MGLGRIQVHLTGLGLTLWAPVLIPGGGAGYGVALTPRTRRDRRRGLCRRRPCKPRRARCAVVGRRARPEAAGSPDESYAIVSPGGAVIRWRIAKPLKPTIDIKTDNGQGSVSKGGTAGRILIEHPSGSITLDANGIAVASETAVSVSASTVKSPPAW
jgi:hypothetical protein